MPGKVILAAALVAAADCCRFPPSRLAAPSLQARRSTSSKPDPDSDTPATITGEHYIEIEIVRRAPKE